MSADASTHQRLALTPPHPLWPHSGGMIETTEQYQFLYSTLAQYSSQLQHRQVRL